RRLLPILMTLVLVCALPIWAAFVTSGDVTNPLVETAEGTTPARVTTESALRTALENGVSGIVLGGDIDISGAALVAKGTSTLDLNGFMLRRVLQSTGSVIQVDAGATLTLTDSGDGSSTYRFVKINDGYWQYSKNGETQVAGGLIAGGSAYPPDGDVNGGGVYVANGGTFIMEKGKIIGCRARNNGGGVYVADGGKFIMNGGEIRGCVTYEGGNGNVYVGAGAEFQMSGSARITECLARSGSGGGVYVAENGTFTMSGSSAITNCKGSKGGAVYNAGTFTMRDNSHIADCIYISSIASGGGVHNKGTFTVEGGSITGSVNGYNSEQSSDDICNENKLDVSEGITISCNVNVGYGGTISKGTFTGRVWIFWEGTILGGTFTNEVINYEGTIKAGEFTGEVTNTYGGTISGGTFDKNVANSAYNAIISNGSFHGTVTNESGATISGGTFNENVTNKTNATLNGGIFYGGVTNDGGKIEDGAYETVTFNSDGGTPVEEAKVLRGQKVAKPTDDPTKSGHTFTGWYLGDEKYNFDTPVTAPLTLTAKWEKVPSSGGYYYYPTTDTKTDDTKGSPKTADPGAALYGALALLSLTGMVALNRKKR
ncbi:MAG: hypothetical protein EGQ29_07265, partial [Clostridiales bacterium]|nr:hypothetical protein [Clostridiales bacterium]